jgi:hypothetical protein
MVTKPDFAAEELAALAALAQARQALRDRNTGPLALLTLVSKVT